MDAGYEGGQILSQLEKSPAEIPDYILFDGGTNDAEYLFNNKEISYGEVTDSKDPQTFDLKTFAGAFENLVYQMQQKWQGADLIYVAVHKMGSRDKEVQEKLRELELKICAKYGVAVADIYEDTELDTNDVNKKTTILLTVWQEMVCREAMVQEHIRILRQSRSSMFRS